MEKNYKETWSREFYDSGIYDNGYNIVGWRDYGKGWGIVIQEIFNNWENDFSKFEWYNIWFDSREGDDKKYMYHTVRYGKEYSNLYEALNDNLDYMMDGYSMETLAGAEEELEYKMY